MLLQSYLPSAPRKRRNEGFGPIGSPVARSRPGVDRVEEAVLDIVEVGHVEQLDRQFQARALRTGKSTQQAHIQVAHPPVTEHIAPEPALEVE